MSGCSGRSAFSGVSLGVCVCEWSLEEFVLQQIRFVSVLIRRSVLVLCCVGVYRHSCVGPVSVRVRCLFVCSFCLFDLTFVVSS